MGKIEDRLEKRIRSLKWARWFLPITGVFVLVCAILVFNQGKKANSIIGRAEYGEFFWNGPDPEREYSGLAIIAENRFSTAMLYSGLSLFMLTGGVIANLNYRRDQNILERINQLKGDPDGGINSVTSLRDSTP